MPKKLVVGNWKMNPQSLKDAETLLKGIYSATKDVKNVEIVVCPPYPYLHLLKKLKLTKIVLGAQNVAFEGAGAYTGEVSASMIGAMSARYTIVGHSERRAMGETNDSVNKKIIQALKAKLTPIVCVGESVRDTHGEYLSFIKQQLHECFNGISKAQMRNMVIAYEPIWAIGSGASREALPEEFTEVRIFIRKTLSDMYSPTIAHATRILYGGSVGPEDVKGFVLEAQADGVLVGRNSLTPKKFAAIVAASK